MLISEGVKRQEDFDDWHFNICCAIRKLYRENGVALTFGQAQKWANMTLKYLYMLENHFFRIGFVRCSGDCEKKSVNLIN